MLPDKITISIISPDEDDAVYINSNLRNAGITVQSIWTKSHQDCIDALKQKKLHLIFIRTKNFSAADEQIIDEIKQIQKHIPVILIHDEVNQKTLTITLQMGAHDLISMDYPDRLTILTCRELGSYLKARELFKLREEIGGYKQELETLKSESTLPAIILVDGIIVETNSAADQLLNPDKQHDTLSSPILDYIHSSEQVLLKGALKAARQGNYSNKELSLKLDIPNHGIMRMGCLLEQYLYEGEKAIRLCFIEIPKAAMVAGDSIQLDPLTKIFHRQQFIESAQSTLQKPLDSGIRSLLYLKIDSFKELQEKVGILHLDKSLEYFAEAMKDTVNKGDVYARFGSYTFAILTQKGTQADVVSWAEHFQKHLNEISCFINDEIINLSCSIGIAEWQQGKDDFSELIQRAKESCDEAKKVGSGQIKVNRHFEDINMRSASYDIEWVARIRQALLQNRFQLFQFPISSLRMTSKNMIDVYLRMQDEDGELILPNVFMPTAERNNLIKSLDRWVLGASVKYCQKHSHAKLFVRLSKKSISDSDLIPWVNKILDSHNVSADKIVIQVVEEDVFARKDLFSKRLNEFRSNGFGIAIEHYGKNPAHIELLDDYPIDFVKIDSTLIQGLTDSRDRQKIVKALCKIAGKKQIATIAEHVETADTMAVLYQLGADYMQGKFTLEPEVILGSDEI